MRRRDFLLEANAPAVRQSGEITGAVGSALDDLPEAYAEVIRMTYGEGMEAPEIAELLGLTPGTVRQYRVRALRVLRDTTTEEGRPHLADRVRYSRETVEDLLPLAMDSEWDGQMPKREGGAKNRNKAPNEGGDGLVMVLDIRRAAKHVGWSADSIVKFLNGDR